MSHSLGDKTQEYAKVWRQHIDPPGFWFAIAIVSVALHLLLFWLMRSYSFSLSRQNQSAIPVEIIEISPQKQRAKVKPKVRTQKSSVKSLAKQVPPKNLTAKPAINQDRKALAYPSKTEGQRSGDIAFAQQRQQQLIDQQQQQRRQQERLSQLAQQQQQRRQQQRLSQLAQQQERLSQLAQQQEQRQQERLSQLAQQQKLAEQERLSQLAEQEQRQQERLSQLAEQQQQRRQQERLSQLAQQQKLAEQERLSQLAQQEQRQQERLSQLAQQQRREQLEQLAEQQRREQQELDDKKNPDPLDAPRTGTGDAPRRQNGGTAQTSQSLEGGLSATWSVSTQEELAINTRGNLPTILKDIELPKLEETTAQESNPIPIPGTFKLQPGKFIFSLIIEKNGKCSQALLQDKNMPSADKKIFEQFGFEEICQKQRFIPAYQRSDRTPLTSNLYVSITIEQKAP